MKLIEICKNGCLIIGEYGEDGTLTTIPFIETGDFKSAQSLLSVTDMQVVQQMWSPELIALRENERKAQVLLFS